MNIFSKKIESLSAIKGLKADAITAEQLAAINAELAEDFPGIEVSLAGTIAGLNDAAKTSLSTIETLTASEKKAQDDLAAANATIVSQKEKLDKVASGTATETDVEKDNITTEANDVDLAAKISNQIREERGL